MSARPAVIVSSWADGLTVFEGGARARAFQGARAWSLASDGAGGVHAIVGSREIWGWTPGGAWRREAVGDTDLACCLTLGGRLLAGTEDLCIVEFSGGRCRQAEDFTATPGREHWYAGAALVGGRMLGPPLGVRTLSATCDGGALLANVHVGGIPRSTDGGATWRPTIDIDADVHQVLGHPARPEIVAAASAAGLCLSRDGGESWTVTAEGLHSPYSLAVGLTQDWVFVSSSTDHFSRDGAVYRRRIDGDGPLEPCGGGLPGRFEGIIDTGCIHARGEDLAIAAPDGGLYGSRDGGQSWTLWEGPAAVQRSVHMLKPANSAPRLIDRTFSALADPHRRHVVELLRERPHRAGELAEAVGLSAPAMSRHLKTLRESRLVEETPAEFDTRVRIYRLRSQPMAHLKAWIEETERLWSEQLSALKTYVEKGEA